MYINMSITNQTKISCGCGGRYLLQNKARHYKTSKHKEHELMLEAVDREWEENKTPKLELELQKFIRDYNIISELKLQLIISNIKENSKTIN